MDALIATCDVCGKEFNPVCGCGKVLAVVGEGHLSMSSNVFEARLLAARIAGFKEALGECETAVENGDDIFTAIAFVRARIEEMEKDSK